MSGVGALKGCSRCGLKRPLDFFYRDSKKADGLGNNCKACDNAAKRAWRKANPEKDRASKRKHRYGIEPDEYDSLKEQGCAICGAQKEEGTGRRLSVDHCHTSGKVRGLLCGLCNRGLGNFKDDPALLLAAVQYLRGD